MHLMEVRLTKKIVGRCDIVERRVDTRCNELHNRFTARGYTIQQEVDVVVYDESSDHDGYGATPFNINDSDEKSIFDEGPIFDEEHGTFSADNMHFNDMLRAHSFETLCNPSSPACSPPSARPPAGPPRPTTVCSSPLTSTTFWGMIAQAM